MKVTFIPSDITAIEMPETILMNEITIGQIRRPQHALTHFHAILEIKGYYSIIQGFGTTRIAAIHNAIASGKENAKVLHEAVCNLEMDLMGETQTEAAMKKCTCGSELQTVDDHFAQCSQCGAMYSSTGGKRA
jgi:hypothetical protein